MGSAQPKIQKMCEEESDDTEAVAKLLEINDSIHRTLQRYKLMKKGDMTAAAQIPKGTLGTSGAGVTKGPDNELSLIDFGPEDALGDEPPAAQAADKAPASLEDDLLGLSVNEGNSGQISLGGAGNCMFDCGPVYPGSSDSFSVLDGTSSTSSCDATSVRRTSLERLNRLLHETELRHLPQPRSHAVHPSSTTHHARGQCPIPRPSEQACKRPLRCPVITHTPPRLPLPPVPTTDRSSTRPCVS